MHEKRCHGHETKKLPLGSGLVHFLTRCVDSFTNCHMSEYHAWNMEECECFNVENSSSCDAFMKRTCFKGRITKVLTSDMALSTLRCWLMRLVQQSARLFFFSFINTSRKVSTFRPKSIDPFFFRKKLVGHWWRVASVVVQFTKINIPAVVLSKSRHWNLCLMPCCVVGKMVDASV